MASSLATHHRGLVLDAVNTPFHIKSLPTPLPTPGTAVVKILEAGVVSYHREIYSGTRPYSLPTPLVGGVSAIGRIAAIGPDAALLQPGQLVYVDCVIHVRDDPDSCFLIGIHTGWSPRSQKLSKGFWHDGTFAECFKSPLENCFVLDETRLCKELGYSLQDLTYICHLIVPFGGLRDIKLEAGETVIVTPATGNFGGAGVQVAAAMGARVIAMGRNEKELARLKAHVLSGLPNASIETVKMTGDQETDTKALSSFGTVDAVLDLTPAHACKSNHLKSAIAVLRRNGRVSLMGYNEYTLDWKVMADNISLKGKLMYEREDVVMFLKMLERGLFPQGGKREKNFVDAKSFPMEQWQEAFDVAAEHTGIGRVVAIEPWSKA